MVVPEAMLEVMLGVPEAMLEVPEACLSVLPKYQPQECQLRGPGWLRCLSVLPKYRPQECQLRGPGRLQGPRRRTNDPPGWRYIVGKD
jgi:hypothetical protein